MEFQLKETWEDRAHVLHDIGLSLMTWASVESRLNSIFLDMLGDSREAADRIWARIRSFEAKLQVLSDAIKGALAGKEDALGDWNLLFAHTLMLYGKRNQIAHATLVLHYDGQAAEWRVIPFYTIEGTQPPIEKGGLSGYTKEFLTLESTLCWFQQTRGNRPPAEPRLQWPEQGPDLVRRLRSEDGQKRARQRLRDLAWRQYQDRNPPEDSGQS